MQRTGATQWTDNRYCPPFQLTEDFPISTRNHFDQLLTWIQMEADAETARMADRRMRQTSKDAERTGETLLDLAIEDSEPLLGGRFQVTLVKRNRELGLPWNRLRVGSPVILAKHKDDDGVSLQGVVSGRNQRAIRIATHHWPDGDSFRLDLAADEMTRRRMVAALELVRQSRGRLGHLRKILMGETKPQFRALPAIVFSDRNHNGHLNISQQDAIRFALSAEDLAVLHGPPGTGKTTTLIELIIQAVQRGEKVLACAPSNTAVDNLLAQLHARQQPAVRLGHPARVADHLQNHTLDALVNDHENMAVVKDMLREAANLERQAERHTRARPAPGTKRELRRDARQLRNHARLLERQAVEHILDRNDIICATTTFDESILGDRRFDMAVIDEACQSTEPGCWIPICRSDKVVLAGDPCQLPPTVISQEAARQGFDQSLMQRQIRLHGSEIVQLLDVQYRMHDQIMRFSSDYFYQGELHSDSSVSDHTLADFCDVKTDPAITTPITFIDTAGAGWEEQAEPDGESRQNLHEAEFLLQKAAELHDAGLPLSDMALIVPYAAQVRLLREISTATLGPGHPLEIDTVDGFQGREKEAVLISLVRSNTRNEIGFLADTRRMNVALTRARRRLVIVGDSATIAGNEFYDSLLAYFDSIDAYHSVWEYL